VEILQKIDHENVPLV